MEPLISKGDNPSTYLHRKTQMPITRSKEAIHLKAFFILLTKIIFIGRQNQFSHLTSQIYGLQEINHLRVRKEPPISYSGSPLGFQDQFSHSPTKHNGGLGTPQTTPQMDQPSNSVKP